MGMIYFKKSTDINTLKDFYTNRLGMELWLDQGSCLIFRHNDYLIGFCEGDSAEVEGTTTFFYEYESELMSKYEELKELADGPPRINEQFNIRQFFIKDPEGRSLEFQNFLHPISWDFKSAQTTHSKTALEILWERRSIRKYQRTPIKNEVLESILHYANCAPTGNNRHPWRFIIVNNRSILNEIADIIPHGKMLLHAPSAIITAAVLDETPVGYNYLDCAAATQNILLAAHAKGLGAVWLGIYPRKERISRIRSLLNIPDNIEPITAVSIGHPDRDHCSNRVRAQFPPQIYLNNWKD